MWETSAVILSRQLCPKGKGNYLWCTLLFKQKSKTTGFVFQEDNLVATQRTGWRQVEQLAWCTNGREGKSQTEWWKWGEKVCRESRNTIGSKKDPGKALRSVLIFYCQGIWCPERCERRNEVHYAANGLYKVFNEKSPISIAWRVCQTKGKIERWEKIFLHL